MAAKDFIRWSRKSAVGHIALCEAIGLIPLSALCIELNYSEGTLTYSWAIFCVFVCACGMVILGLLNWFTIVKPRARP